MNDIDTRALNALRILSADAIQKANSGHPGLPLGSAPIAYELWANHMKHNPENPNWLNRDRFILSAGHGSMLLYSLLYLFQYGKLSLDDLKSFRQLGSKTPGHPEYGHTVGVEATTGPLGAGMGMAVGMAMAERHMASVFNRDGYKVFDNYTYVLGGDGCLMEGISSEAFSLAGTLKLSKLIVLYDSNNISIEGSTDLAFTENVVERMSAFGFQTLEVEDGNDIVAVGKAIELAKQNTEKPSFITIHTEIGYGCPQKQGKASAHGEPLGADNVAEMRKFLGWDQEEVFEVPDDIYAHYKKLRAGLVEKTKGWEKMFEEYKRTYPELKKLLEQYFDADYARRLLENDSKFWAKGEKPEATRAISGKILNMVKDGLPNLMGGSADLAPSNKTYLNGVTDFSANSPEGRNIHFGVRELAMGAIANGIMLYGGLRAYIGTFFVFSDYTKPMARLSSLMKLPVVYVYTHDSIGVGEDGPTHEPIEQLAMLRAMPNFNVFRPCDATETEAAWYSALTSHETPTALVLTRQNLTVKEGSSKEALKGGYIIDDCLGIPDAIIIATGSEVEIAIDAKKILEGKDRKIRVVSMPCQELYDAQDDSYKNSVLPKEVKNRASVEALSTFGWERYVGLEGLTIGMTTFGASGTYQDLYKHFGFTAEMIASAIEKKFF